MKKLFLCIALAMVSLIANAQEVKNEVKDEPVVACLKKAMFITDLQAARSDLVKRAKQYEQVNDSILALSLYRKIMDIDMRIAQLSYELREALYSVPEQDQNSNEMDFIEQIMSEMDK